MDDNDLDGKEQRLKKKSSLRGLTFLVGGIIGVAFVRYLLLEPLELIGWRIYWNGLSNGRIMNPDMVFGSTTFLKCAGGFIVGGLLGLVRIGCGKKKRKTNINSKNIDKE